MNRSNLKEGDVLLAVKDISLSFGAVQAISNVTFDIRKGEVRAIIGPNGAGKTSMLNVINGFYHPQEGTITFAGETRSRMLPHEAAAQGISRTFQNVALFKGMSTLDNIMTGRVLKQKASLIEQAFYFGRGRSEEIEHREFEPMAGMNLEEKEDMSRYIMEVREQFGTTVALIEHDMGVVMDLSDRVVVLDYGQQLADGTPEQVSANQEVIDAYLGVSHD